MVPVMVHCPKSPGAANPDPETVKVVPGAEGGPGIGGDPLEGEIEIVGAAFTVSIEFSAETNNDSKSTRKVTVNLKRRSEYKSRYTSLKLFD